MADLSDFQKECVRLALVRMFKTDSYFNICAVDDCLKLTGAVPPRAEYDALRTLHCVHFREMTPAMRQMVAERTCALFDYPGFDLPQLDRAFLPSVASNDPARLTLWQRAKGALSA